MSAFLVVDAAINVKITLGRFLEASSHWMVGNVPVTQSGKNSRTAELMKCSAAHLNCISL